MRIRIGVDLDSTLNTFEHEWLRRYNEDYNDSLIVENMIDWDPIKYIKPECGLKIFDYLREPGFFANLGIKENAKEVMEYLWQYFEIYIVSSSHPKVVGDKWDWIEKHFPFIPTKNFVPLHEKDLFKIEYLIDDGPHNIEQFSGISIIMDMPYNRYLTNKHKRVYNWLEIKQYFQDIICRRDNTKNQLENKIEKVMELFLDITWFEGQWGEYNGSLRDKLDTSEQTQIQEQIKQILCN
jgi:5'-nucleotidase